MSTRRIGASRHERFGGVTYLIPLRYFVIILRGIFLKGVGLETLWPQALALLGWGVAILALAIARSSKRLA